MATTWPSSKQIALVRVEVVEDVRRLVDGAADAVPGDLAHDREAAPAHLRVDHAADVRDAVAGTDVGQGLHERRVCGIAQRLMPGRHLADRHRDRGVGDVAVEPRRHVELHEVAGREAPRAGDAVHDLVVDADAAEAGEAVDRLRRRFGALSAQEGRRRPRRGPPSSRPARPPRPSRRSASPTRRPTAAMPSRSASLRIVTRTPLRGSDPSAPRACASRRGPTP